MCCCARSATSLTSRPTWIGCSKTNLQGKVRYQHASHTLPGLQWTDLPAYAAAALVIHLWFGCSKSALQQGCTISVPLL